MVLKRRARRRCAQRMAQEVPAIDTEIVTALSLALAKRVTQERFDLWFGTVTRMKLVADVLTVEVPNQFKLDWLRHHFRADIEAVCADLLALTPRIEFRVNSTLTPLDVSAASGASEPQADAVATTVRLRIASPRGGSRRRFASLDSFVIGNGNRVAHTAANMVVQRLGAVTPLLLYGSNGVGKTHLLEGIWSAVRKASPMHRVVYLSAEQFTSYFLEALRGTGLPNFRRKYRDVQLLIIDDVQFFAGKRATLTELVHTFDTLLREGRQLVVAADRSPAELAVLGPELTTRMSGGLVCAVEPADAATRLGILRQMAGSRHGVDVPDEVLKYIATPLTGDARALRGALNRLQATSQALTRPITMAMAEEALAELIHECRQAVRLPDIERAVCNVLGLEPRSLQSGRKSKGVSHPRMLAMWLARKHTRAALSEISSFFGRRSHSTVISAQKKVTRWMADDAPLQTSGRMWKVDEAIRRIEANLRAG